MQSIRNLILNNIISVIGLGKLGLPLACCLADASFDTIGADISEDVVQAIACEKVPANIYENGLQELLVKSIQSKKLRVTTTVEWAVELSNVIFVIVPTPSLANDKFDMKYIEMACKSIGKVLAKCNDYKVVDIVSTILPGDMQKSVIDILEKVSGKRLNENFGVCYNPEFIALGNVINGITKPDFVMIGASDDKAGEAIKEVYAKLLKNSAPIIITTIANAELAKISLNVFVTMKIAYAEMLAEMCEKIPGCDVDTITKLVGMDSRIGPKYMQAGLPYGGPCFPRDNKAFSAVANDLYGLSSPGILSRATDAANTSHAWVIKDKIYDILEGITGKTISFLGITYKPDTNVLECSGSLYVANLLLDNGAIVKVYDPSNYDPKLLDKRLIICSSIEECLKDSDLAIIATQWEQFKKLVISDFKSMRTKNILDCWRLYNPKYFELVGFKYYCIGRYGS